VCVLAEEGDATRLRRNCIPDRSKGRITKGICSGIQKLTPYIHHVHLAKVAVANLMLCARVCVCVYACVYVCMFVCVCVCVYVCVDV